MVVFARPVVGRWRQTLSPLWFVIDAGRLLVEIAKNALNEVVDYQSGVDPVDDGHRTPLSGGKKSIVQGNSRSPMPVYRDRLFCSGCGGRPCPDVFVEPRIFWIGLAGLYLRSYTAAAVQALLPWPANCRG